MYVVSISSPFEALAVLVCFLLFFFLIKCEVFFFYYFQVLKK